MRGVRFSRKERTLSVIASLVIGYLVSLMVPTGIQVFCVALSSMLSTKIVDALLSIEKEQIIEKIKEKINDL